MKKYYKFLIILLVVSFVVPQIALASWWNPFSWNIWNKIFHRTDTKTQVLENRVKELENKLDEQTTPTPATSGQSILTPKTAETTKQPETTIKKPETETNTLKTETYRAAGINSIATIIEKYKLEQNFCNGMVDFANLRISNREKLKTNATNTLSAIDPEMVYLMNRWYDMEIKYAQEIRAEFISENNDIQKNINSLQTLSNALATSKETIDNNMFVESIKKPIDTHIKAIGLMWEYLDKFAVAFKKEVDSQDSEFSGNILPRLIASSPSSAPTYQPSATYEIHYTPLQFNFLDYIYKNQQLEVLQNISGSLLRIANNY